MSVSEKVSVRTEGRSESAFVYLGLCVCACLHAYMHSCVNVKESYSQDTLLISYYRSLNFAFSKFHKSKIGYLSFTSHQYSSNKPL